MSDARDDTTPTAAAPVTPTIVWPDLSAYGVTLGVVSLDNDRQQLIYADESGKYKHIAKNMGFSRTRWEGLWVRSDLRVEASAFRAAFPKVVVKRRTEQEISDTALEKIRLLVEVARQDLLPGFDAIGPMDEAGQPKPRSAPVVKRTVTRGAAGEQEVLDGEEIDLSPLIAEARLMGTNLTGEEVYEAPGGARFVRFQVETDDATNDRVVRELIRVGADDMVAARFLRAETDGALDLCAQAFVKMMAEGHTARVDELQRFFRAVTGREFAQEDPDMGRVIGAIDTARVARLNQRLAPVVSAEGVEGERTVEEVQIAGAEMFRLALRLHESAQYYSVVKSERMTPLPIGIVFQHIASAMPQGSSVRVDNAAHGEFGTFGGDGSLFRTAAKNEVPDILMGAYSGKLLDQAVQAFGTAVTREDHANVLTSLERMPAQGLGVFVIEGDAVAGRIGPSSRRFLDALANLREIEGIVDVDGTLMGVPGALPSRIIVVGNKREVPGHGGLPPSLPSVTDYDALWAWGAKITEAIRKPGSVPYIERGGVSKETTFENVFQAPYIPASMVSDPALMIPRNLASPTRRAMLEVMKETPHIDSWVMNRLEFPDMKALSEAASSEQVDGVALGMHRAESGLGFMTADQTGIGKGRMIALLARAARIKGEPVLFLTEKAELFQDLWRDIEDTNSEAYFKRLFILNDGAEIISQKTGEVVASSAPREDVERVMRSMKFPDDVDIVFATYSQFNQDPVKAIKRAGKIDIDSHTQLQVSASARRLMDWVAGVRKDQGKKPAKEVIVEAVTSLHDPAVIADMPMLAVKSLWIGRATKGTMLIMDESHNASGESSQTNLNLTHGVMGAESVLYSSATFARGEANMRIYRRLFPSSVDVEGLHETLKKGGEPLQESLASMLAEDGALIRREHDLSMLKFDPRVDNKRTARNEKYADQLAEILAAMTVLSRESRQMSDALSDETRKALKGVMGKDADVSKVGLVQRNAIGNSLYTIMRGFLSVMTCELAVEEAVTALKEGRKPVLVIDHTMEAELNKRIDDSKLHGLGKETPDGYMMKAPGFRSILHNRMDALLKVSVDGKDLGLRGNPVFAEVIAQIDKLISKFPDLPTSPIDIVREGVERAGYSTAELSGRQKRVRYLKDGNVVVQAIPKKERKQARDRFNNGDAHAIVLTRAGNAGISLHDSYKFINRGQRELIEVEVPEDVIARTQFFGRVNRNGQLSYPVIKTLSTGLPAQNRVLALQNNKMRRMSANITANRDNAAITRDVPDVLNSVGNEVAYRFLELDPDLAQKLDIDLEAKTKRAVDASLEATMDDGEPGAQLNLSGEKFVSALMNRLVILPISQQKSIIEAISSEFHAVVEELDARGENPLRPKFYDVNATKIDTEVLELASAAVNESGNARASSFDKSVFVSTIEYTEWSEPFSGRELTKRMKEADARTEGVIDQKFGDLKAYQDWTDANPKALFQEFLVDSLVGRRDELLTRFLNKDHETIASAISAPDNNMVKQLDQKITALATVLSTMSAGSRIRWFDEWRNTVEDHAIVLNIVPPEDRQLHNPGQYRVNIAIPGTRNLESISLSALMSKTGFEVLETDFNPAVLKEFDSRKRASFQVERPVLDGNLFRAAEMAIQTGKGSTALYSDEVGMVNRAVVMPLDFNPRYFAKLPLRVHAQKVVRDFFNDVESGTLHSTSGAMKQLSDGAKLMKKGMSIQKTGKEFIVSVPGTNHWVNWLRNHPEMMNVTGPFGGTRTKLFATVPHKDLDALVRAVYKTGMTMYAHGDDYCKPLNAAAKAPAKSVREWFSDRFGAEVEELNNTHGLTSKDPFAKLDDPHKRTLKAA